MQWNYNDRVFNNRSSLAQTQRVVMVNFLLSFAFSALKVSDFTQVWANYSVGAALLTRDASCLSFPYKFTCPRGNVEGARREIKLYNQRKSNCAKSRSRIKIIYTILTREDSRARVLLRLAFQRTICSEWPTNCVCGSIKRLFRVKINKIRNVLRIATWFRQEYVMARITRSTFCTILRSRKNAREPLSPRMRRKFISPRGNVGTIWTRRYKTLCWRETFVGKLPATHPGRSLTLGSRTSKYF